jgi:homoserine O-acetyltransferase
MNPDVFDTLIILACGARATPWVVAQNEAQRMAIEADATFYYDVPDGGQRGLAAARAMALITYRNYTTYNDTQHDPDRCKLSDFRASSYQRHQGDKLVRRFDAYSYHRLTQAMDAFDVSRGRGDDVCKVLKINNIRTLVVGISTDVLFPVAEQQWIAAQMPNAVYEEVNSKFGHDGFLIETAQVSRLIAGFLS